MEGWGKGGDARAWGFWEVRRGGLRGKRGGVRVCLLACLATWVDGPMDGVGGLVCRLGGPGPDATQTHDGFLARLLGLMGRWIRPRNKGWGLFGTSIWKDWL